MAKESQVSFYSEADLAQTPSHLPGPPAMFDLWLKPMWLEWKVTRKERQDEVQKRGRQCIMDGLSLILSQMKRGVIGWLIRLTNYLLFDFLFGIAYIFLG